MCSLRLISRLCFLRYFQVFHPLVFSNVLISDNFCKFYLTTKTTKGTTRVTEISHLRAGNHSESMEKEKQHRSTSRSMITTSQECTGEHPRPVSSLLKGLIRRKNNEKTNLSNAATKNKLSCKSTSCIGITPSECFLSKEQSYRDPK